MWVFNLFFCSLWWKWFTLFLSLSLLPFHLDFSVSYFELLFLRGLNFIVKLFSKYLPLAPDNYCAALIQCQECLSGQGFPKESPEFSVSSWHDTVQTVSEKGEMNMHNWLDKKVIWSEAAKKNLKHHRIRFTNRLCQGQQTAHSVVLWIQTPAVSDCILFDLYTQSHMGIWKSKLNVWKDN